MIILEASLDDVDEADLTRFTRRARKLAGVSGEVAVLITGNRQIRQLNRRFRKKDKPTDVLSFPREDGGDIAISAQIATENARRYGHAPADEFKVLILHGMLHLAGYDHETDHGAMAAQERGLRKKLKLPDSLIQRTQVAASRRRPR
ncbi:MAG: rRNA maturation RNase YbeY [Candidatus Angelobacter sp. Gp1-AA117]|nr:MAG: rRNA maturation RNase YbeY [Candidatus Angelobacter sp. Gp1-AA117]